MIPNKILNKYNNRFRKLVQEDIRKKGLIKTGDLYKSIDINFETSNTGIKIKIGAMFYYRYLDDGTRYIKAFDISKDVLNSKEFKDMLDDMYFEYIDYEIDDGLSK